MLVPLIQDMHGHDAPAGESGAQAAAHRFYLGQPRHRSGTFLTPQDHASFVCHGPCSLAAGAGFTGDAQDAASSRRRGTIGELPHARPVRTASMVGAATSVPCDSASFQLAG